MINWFDVGVSKKLKIFPLRKIESTQQQKKMFHATVNNNKYKKTTINFPVSSNRVNRAILIQK